MPDHGPHRAGGLVAVGKFAGFEKIADVVLAPLAGSLLRDVRNPALAFGVGPAGEALRRDNAAKEVSRAVTLRAMAEAVDEIGTAIPLRRARGIRCEWLAIHEQQFPDPEIAPDIEWKRHVMIAHFARYGGERFFVGEEVKGPLHPSNRPIGIKKERGIMETRPGDRPRAHAPPLLARPCAQ